MASPLKKCNTCGREYRRESDFLVRTSRWRMCDRGNLWFNCQCSSTIMIKKGKFSWYSPDKFMSGEAASVFNTLPGLQELPHLPTAVMELQTLIKDEKANSSQLAAISKGDPLIASKILKIANNLKSGPGHTIESLEHAITYIGLNTLADIVLTASISAFPFETKIFKSDDFWQEAFLTGRIAETLAQRFAPSVVPDEAYLAGALCNVGKVIMAICFPKKADLIARDCADVNILCSWREGEKTHQAQDHTILGEIAATLWGLPEYIMICAAKHHDLCKATKEPDINVIVTLANQLTHWVQLTPTRIDEELLNSAFKAVGLDEQSGEALAAQLIPLKQSA